MAANYGNAVVAAVAGRLAELGYSRGGIVAASRASGDSSLSGKVSAMRQWLRDTHGLDDDAVLPAYEKHWSKTPLRNKLPSEWSAAWRLFHDTYVAPEIEKQKMQNEAAKLTELAGKRPKRSSSPGAIDDDVLASLGLDELADLENEGDVHFTGYVHAKGFVAENADFAEAFASGRDLAPGMVVGLGRDCKLDLHITSSMISVGIVSTAPSVMGDGGSSDGVKKYPVCQAGWPGQVECRVVGPVAPGDVLVPSGRNDGTAVVLSTDHLAPTHRLGKVEHVAAADDGSGVRMCLVLMGVAEPKRMSKNQLKKLRKREAKRAEQASLAQKEAAPMHPRDEAGWDMCGLESGTDAGESDTGTSTSSFDHIMSSKLSDPAASELRELFLTMQAEMQQLRRHNQVRRTSQPGQAWSLEWL